MFKCDDCCNDSPVGTTMSKVPVETRTVTYANESFGTEIVKEKRVCVLCAGIQTPKALDTKRPQIDNTIPGRAPWIASEYVE